MRIYMQMSVHLWFVLGYACGVYVCMGMGSICAQMSMRIYLFMSMDTWCVVHTLGSWIEVCFIQYTCLGLTCESTLV